MDKDHLSFWYTMLVGLLAVWGFSERLDTLAAKAERNDLRAELQLLTLQHDAEISNAKYIVARAVQDNRSLAEGVEQLSRELQKYHNPLANCYSTGGGK